MLQPFIALPPRKGITDDVVLVEEGDMKLAEVEWTTFDECELWEELLTLDTDCSFKLSLLLELDSCDSFFSGAMDDW